jgi:hypothetical protein
LTIKIILIIILYMMTRTQTASPNYPVNMKPCQNCGEATPVGAIACAPCQREWQLQFFKSRPWLDAARREAA